jgi:starch synthase (maltosyl-transferring)
MKELEGRQRVIIEHVTPQIECGKFPIKRVVGEKVTVRADVFGDGHDDVRAVLRYKPVQKDNWEEVPMTFLGNDRWEASFIPDTEGRYEYTILGWVDHFQTWQKGLKKKFEANQNVTVELLIGSQLMTEAAGSASGNSGKRLNDWAEQLKETSNGASATGVTQATSEEVTKLMNRFGKRDFASTYHKNLLVDVERRKALFSTWYEFFPRSASPEPGRHGTFKDCHRILPEIARMGFDIIYFPPIHPIGRTFRKGKNNSLTAQPGEPGSCWAIGSDEGGHKSIHPELGSMQDFQDLVWSAGELGIEIALDIALQCTPDHPYVKEHPQWFKWRPDGTVQYAENPPKKYQDILPINFETEDWQNLWQELKSIFTFWIDKGVKVFRVDNPHTKAFGFWEWCIGEIRATNPEVIFLSEAFTRPRVMERLAKIGFNQSYTYFTWRNEAWEIKQYMHELTQTEQREYFRPNFWPNTPDILPQYLQHGGEPAHIVRLIMAATLSSNYGLYGQVYENAINTPTYPGKEEYLDSEKYEIKYWDWFKYTKIKDVMTRINQIRRENPALQTTWHVHFADTDNQQLLCYAKMDQDGKNKLLIVLNLDHSHSQAGFVKVPVHWLGLESSYSYVVHDLLNGSRYTWRQEWNYVELHPNLMPAHVFRIEVS